MKRRKSKRTRETEGVENPAIVDDVVDLLCSMERRSDEVTNKEVYHHIFVK